MKNGALRKTNELFGTSFAAIYASAYVAAIKDYSVKHNIQITNNKLFSIVRSNDPLKNKKINIQIKKYL